MPKLVTSCAHVSLCREGKEPLSCDGSPHFSHCNHELAVGLDSSCVIAITSTAAAEAGLCNPIGCGLCQLECAAL